MTQRAGVARSAGRRGRESTGRPGSREKAGEPAPQRESDSTLRRQKAEGARVSCRDDRPRPGVIKTPARARWPRSARARERTTRRERRPCSSCEEHCGGAPERSGQNRCERQILPQRRGLVGLVNIGLEGSKSRVDPPAFDCPVVVMPAPQRLPPPEERRVKGKAPAKPRPAESLNKNTDSSRGPSAGRHVSRRGTVVKTCTGTSVLA